MKQPSLLRCLFLGAALAAGGTPLPTLSAQVATPDAPPAVSPPSSAETTRAASAESPEEGQGTTPGKRRSGLQRTRGGASTSGSNRIAIGHDAHLAAGERAESVVAIFGSATSDGDVSDSVFSLLGDTQVNGPVGDSAVAVLGSTYINARVRDSVVAVLGSVELGPQADVGGDVVAIGGLIIRDPAAVVRGEQQNVSLAFDSGRWEWLYSWFTHCVRLARPLAIAPHLGWAWLVALSFLTLYIALALLFRDGVERCLHTLESRPGHSVLAALLSVLLAPVVMVLLAVTGVGLFVVPFVLAGLYFAAFFGKAVMLAWLGRRVTHFFGDGPLQHVAVAVLFGGIIVLCLYLVPVLGLVTFKLLGWIGMGVVIYTLALGLRRETPNAMAAGAGASSFAGAAGGFPEPFAMAAAPVLRPSVSAATLPRAGFWIRVAALLLDVILISLLAVLTGGGGPVLLLVLAAYGAVMWRFRGTTIGGIVCGLKVVRVDDREMDWTTAIVRALACFLSLAVVGLGFIWVAFDAEKQSWHDKIAGTTVVRPPKGVSLV